MHLCPIPKQRLPKMSLDATLRIIEKWRYMRNGDCPPTRFQSVFQQKRLRMRIVGIMTMDGKWYVIVFIPCHDTDLIFFTNTVQRVLLLIRSIWVGKLFTVFILLLGRSEVILTSRLLSQLLNLLSIIERPRTIFNTSSNFLLHCWTAGMEWMEK